jgi:hypothetical protein
MSTYTWSRIPPEAITSGRHAWAPRDERFPHERLGDNQWSAFLTAWKNQPHRDIGEKANRPWRRMPARFIRQAIGENLILPHEHAVLRQIWRTAASTVREELERLLQEGNWEQAMTLA